MQTWELPTKCCQKCEFFIGWPPSIYGKCVRYPPIGMSNEHGTSAFPDVKIGEWCGEFKPVSAPAAGGES